MKHEYIAYSLIHPLVSVINALANIGEDEIYRSKERIVDLLAGLLNSPEETV